MFFTRTLRVLAWLWFVVGIALIVGFSYFALTDLPTDRIERYLPGGVDSGIGIGLKMIVFGLVFGTLAEISVSQRR